MRQLDSTLSVSFAGVTSDDARAVYRPMDVPTYIELVTEYAERIVASIDNADPVEAVTQAIEQLYNQIGPRDFRDWPESCGHPVMVWGFLSDAIVGPPSYARGVADPIALIRRAAAEWLALDKSPDAIGEYHDRWTTWPESLGDDA